ncbi:O-antigen ligase family protein [Sulfurimonas sp.]
MLSDVKNFIFSKAKEKDFLTIWMNNLLVVYAFLLPISQTIKSTVFVLMLFLLFLRGNVVEDVKKALHNRVVRAFVYLFLIYGIGLFWSDNIKEGLSALKSIKYGLYLILFYTIVDGRYITKVIGAFILGMLVSELTSYGIILGVMPWELTCCGINFYATPSLEDPSPFLNHIHYGVALSFVVLLLGQKVFYSKSSLLLKIFMIMFIMSATANIFVTGGRTGYSSFIFLMVVLCFFYLKKYAIGIVVFVVLVFSLAYMNSTIFKKKIAQTQESLLHLTKEDPDFNTSLGARIGIIYYGYQSIKSNPLFGVGTGGAMTAIKNITPEKWTEIHRQPHAHNQFLSIFISLGIVGLLIFLNIYYQIFRYKQEDKELRFIMIFATLAITVGILSTQFNLRFFMPLWVVMLSVTLIGKDRRTITGALDESRENMHIVVAVAVFSITYLLKQLF